MEIISDNDMLDIELWVKKVGGGAKLNKMLEYIRWAKREINVLESNNERLQESIDELKNEVASLRDQLTS